MDSTQVNQTTLSLAQLTPTCCNLLSFKQGCQVYTFYPKKGLILLHTNIIKLPGKVIIITTLQMQFAFNSSLLLV